ncbi:MAG: hypothetical protein HY22_01870 [[Candidatus Thermochlorobacteriaceae] bacterium GBChlB]|nr:MAG: hypothetical protein HY22_01870 [[Candidatus Thermochlorobacteriaceae] bacterium GBChlB]
MRKTSSRTSSLYVSSLLLAIFFLSSCTPNQSLPTDGGQPGTGSRGSFDAVRYVSIGNSITAGFLSNSLYEAGQRNSYPYLIARQAHGVDSARTIFQMPIFSDPGTPGRIELGGFTTTGTPITVINPSAGQPTNLTLPRPYNNLGVPGMLLAEAPTATSSASSLSRSAALDFVLRNPTLGNRTTIQQALALTPTFITFHLGNNDVLGYATSGGVSPAAPVPTALFRAALDSSLSQLRRGAPNAKIVALNVPDVSVIPFVTTAGPLVRTAFAVGQSLGRIPAAVPGVFYHRRGSLVPGLPIARDSAAIMRTADMGDLSRPTGCAILLTGAAVGTGLGSTANPARSVWLGLFNAYRAANPTLTWEVFRTTFFAPALDTLQPFGLSPANPVPNQWVLDESEIATARAAVGAYNEAIQSQVTAGRAVAVIDINGLFGRILRNELVVDGELLKADLGTGSVISLDGVHPSPKAHGVIANEILRIINREFNATIPLVIVRDLPNGLVQAGQSATVSSAATDLEVLAANRSLFEQVAKSLGAFSDQRDQK